MLQKTNSAKKLQWNFCSSHQWRWHFKHWFCGI